MKRLLTLIALLGIVGLFAGCQESSNPQPPANTNAPAAPAAPSTNAPK